MNAHGAIAWLAMGIVADVEAGIITGTVTGHEALTQFLTSIREIFAFLESGLKRRPRVTVVW